MLLAEAFALFRRLGVNIETMNQRDFSISYFALAKRYHPDRNPHSAELIGLSMLGGDIRMRHAISPMRSATNTTEHR
jgi:curved DNA-binding protein CbpA